MNQIHPLLGEMYQDLEPMLNRLIRSQARRLWRYMEHEDLMQEGRIVAMQALSKYDHTRCEGIERYVSKCLSNAFRSLYHKLTAQSRMPRVAYKNDSGKYERAPTPPLPLEQPGPSGKTNLDTVASEWQTPEDALAERESVDQTAALITRLIDNLNEREAKLFMDVAEPVLGLNTGERPANCEVGAHRGMTKNMVDWALFHIRARILELGDDEFEELLGTVVNSEGWPRITQFSGDNVAAAHQHVRRCGLSLEGQVGQVERVGRYARRVDQYSWGAILFVSRDDEAYTFVCRGRLNLVVGHVLGTKLGVRKLPIGWYSSLVKKFNASPDRASNLHRDL